jgi:hypothetical protein
MTHCAAHASIEETSGFPLVYATIVPDPARACEVPLCPQMALEGVGETKPETVLQGDVEVEVVDVAVEVEVVDMAGKPKNTLHTQEDPKVSDTFNKHIFLQDSGIRIIPFMTEFSTTRTKGIVSIQGSLILTLLDFRFYLRNLTITKVSETSNVSVTFSNLPS